MRFCLLTRVKKWSVTANSGKYQLCALVRIVSIHNSEFCNVRFNVVHTIGEDYKIKIQGHPQKYKS